MTSCLGTIVLGWPGLRLNAQAFHRRRMMDLENRLVSDQPAGTSRVFNDIAGGLRSEIERERKAATDWSKGDAICLFTGYLLVLCAGFGEFLLATPHAS